MAISLVDRRTARKLLMDHWDRLVEKVVHLPLLEGDEYCGKDCHILHHDDWAWCTVCSLNPYYHDGHICIVNGYFGSRAHFRKE